jgi:hypothetical protein
LPAAAVSDAPIACDMAPLLARWIAVGRPPADQPKNGIHGDLPIALGPMTALGAVIWRIRA